MENHSNNLRLKVIPEIVGYDKERIDVLPKKEFDALLQRVIFTRHGKTLYNLEGRLMGSIDEPLSTKGKEEMEEYASSLANKFHSVKSVITSDLLRAKETAIIFAKAFHLETAPIRILKGLREISFGDWEGRLDREIKDDPQSEFEEWQKHPLLYSNPKLPKEQQLPHNGEPVFRLLSRINNALHSLVINPDMPLEESSMIVVTHGTASRAIRYLRMFAPDRQGNGVDFDTLKRRETEFYFYPDGQFIKPPHAPYYIDKQGYYRTY